MPPNERAVGRERARHAQAGVTYLYVMFVITVMGLALAGAGALWHVAQQREKERELLFVGDQFRRAIAAYFNAHAGRADRYPRELNDLLEDRNSLPYRRYLRQLYLDPMTGKAQWGLLRNAQGGIYGVYSLAEGKPLKTGNFRTRDAALADQTRYTDWKFIADPATRGSESRQAALR